MRREVRILVVAVALATVLVLGAVAFLVLTGNRPGGSVAVQLERVTTAQWPIALGFASADRAFFAERNSGAIRILQGGAILPTPFYTLSGTATAGERGLLGLALDPGFPTTPYVYAFQTYNDVPNGTVYNRIVRIQAIGDVGTAHSVILRMPPLSGATNHNGGVIAFGPDGKLYAVVGENADPALAQSPTSLLGKVLRMNPDGSPPSDNPFFGSSTWDDLIYTYGHRNMFGIAFQPVTGRAYATENGPTCNDELNLLTNGSNYGWGPSATCSGSPAPPANTNRDGPSPVSPVRWWGSVIVPTNVAFYTASIPAESRDHLIVGSFRDRRIYDLALSPDGMSVVSETTLAVAPEGIVDVEMGRDGLLWVTTPSAIYRVVPVPTSTYIVSPTGLGAGGVLAAAQIASSPRRPDGRNDRSMVGAFASHPGNLRWPRDLRHPRAGVSHPE